MYTKKEITEFIKTQFGSAKERGQFLAQALKARGVIAATHRRLRGTFAELGEYVMEEMESGRINYDDPDLMAFRTRIKGLQAELGQREEALKEILEGGKQQETEEEEEGEEAAEKGEEKKAEAEEDIGSASTRSSAG